MGLYLGILTDNDCYILRVVMIMKRNILWNLIANIIPIVLMNIVGHATFYIDSKHFEAQITLLISTMLVLTTQ